MMWKDSETNIDYLNIRHIVEMLNNLILDDNLTPATIGVYGAWGSGKSSVLTMSEKILSEKPKVLCVKFNSWMFEDYYDIRAALISTIVQDMSTRFELKDKLLDKAKKLIKSINILGLIKKGIGYGLDIALNKGANIIEGFIGSDTQKDDGEPESENSLRESIRAFPDIFTEIINKTGLKRVAVYIDELDRCTPDRIIDVLEAIRLFAFVPGISFVIGADERLIKYAVDCKYENLPGNDVSIGKEYLDKLIQYTVYIPILSVEEMSNYICLLYLENLENLENSNKTNLIKKVLDSMNNDISYKFSADIIGKGYGEEIVLNLRDIENKAKMLSIIFELGFQGNPRKCKRFLNILAMRTAIAKMRNLDINEAVLCKLMMLEYYKPEIYNALLNEQSKTKGYARALRLKDIPIDDPYAKYREDEWFNSWLSSEPTLNEIELGNYIYISRTNYRVGYASVAMSQFAETVYKALSVGGIFNENKAFEQFEKLSDDEAGAIYEQLVQDINVKPEKQSTLIKYLIRIAIQKKVFKNRTIEYLNSLKSGHTAVKIEVDNFKKHYNLENELNSFYKKLSEDKAFKQLAHQVKRGDN
ncbi:MAG: KAP family NTPase [Lachnospiraceae bacterium]|nr:KAP family NTPase [Lachnospiraceae bacterium]